MGFTRSTTETDVHSTLGDFPAEDDHLTSEQLKERFDAPATGLKSDLNGLMDELEETTSAASVGAAPMTADDSSQANVQAKLDKLYQDLQSAALGDIPDNSVTEAKLAASYAASVAKKDGTLQTNLNADQLDGYEASSFGLKNGNVQTNLNAEKLGGKTLAQVMSDVNSRTSASDYSYSGTPTYHTNVSQSITSIKSRYILFIGCYGSTSFPSDYSSFWAIYDCRTNLFLVAMQAKGDSAKAQYMRSGLDLWTNTGFEIKDTNYSNGTMSFNIYSDITSSSSDAKRIVLKGFQLDGLLP